MDKFLKKLYENKVEFRIDTCIVEPVDCVKITFSKDICHARYFYNVAVPSTVDIVEVLMVHLDKFLKDYWKFGDKPGLAYDFESMLD